LGIRCECPAAGLRRIAVDVLARLDAAAVRVSGARVGSGVAPVALDLPALTSDGYEPAEGPGALVRVLAPLLVVPRVQLGVGQHLAQLVPAHVCESRQALAAAEVRRSLGVAARIAVEVEEEAELDADAVDRPRAVPRAVAGGAAGLVR